MKFETLLNAIGKVSLILVPGDDLKEGTMNLEVVQSARNACRISGLCEVLDPIIPPVDSVSNPDQWIDIVDNADGDLVVTIGYYAYDAVKEASEKYPDRKYLMLDYEFQRSSNVQGAVFKEVQMGYVAGKFAASVSNNDEDSSGVVGVVGGQRIPPVNRFITGFYKGVKSECKDCVVSCAYGESFAGESSQTEMLTNELRKRNVDVIAHHGGTTGTNVIQQMADDGSWVIGFGTDQWYTNFGLGSVRGSEKIVGSVLKVVGEVVQKNIRDAFNGSFRTGTVQYGVGDLAISVSDCHETCRKLPSDSNTIVSQALNDLDTGMVTIYTNRDGVPEDGTSICDTEYQVKSQATTENSADSIAIFQGVSFLCLIWSIIAGFLILK